MIKNDLQYRIAKSSLKKFRATLENHDELTSDQEEWVKEAHKATIVGEILQLEESIKDYEQLKNRQVQAPSLELVEQIPEMLIKNRIALGWTHEDLAKRLGVRPQQVQNDEATNYESASLSRLRKTAEVLQRARRKRSDGRANSNLKGG